MFLISKKSEMNFQADALSSPCDWLDFQVPRFDWLRPLSNEHQLENLPEFSIFAFDRFKFICSFGNHRKNIQNNPPVIM